MAIPIQPLSEITGTGATPQVYDRTRRRSRIIETDFNQFWDEMTGKLEQTERHFDEIKYREALRNQRYYNGQFFWRFSDEDHSVRDLPHTDEDPFFPDNWFQYFADLSIAAALEAVPDMIIDPAGKDERNVRTARAAALLGDNLETEILTEEFRLESEKIRQLECGVWWYSRWSTEAGSLWREEPIFSDQPRQREADAAFVCKCTNMGPYSRLIMTDFGPSCPQCMRRDGLMIIETDDQEGVSDIVGYEKFKVGFPTCEPVSPLQMHGDRRPGHYMLGNWLCRARLLDKDTVGERIPWWDSEKAGGKSDNASIRAQEQVRRPVSMQSPSRAMPGTSDRSPDDIPVYQWWFQPCKYEHIEFDKDVEFIGEKVTKIPKHTRLGEVFPNGLYRLKVGNEWLDHRGENFRKHWVYIPYVYNPHQADGGTTISTMAEPQQKLNKVGSLLYLTILAKAGGAPTIIMPPLSETDFDGSPLSITRLPYGAVDDIRKLFFQPEYPGIDQSMMNYVTRMAGEMQVTGQVVSPNTTGDPAAMEMGGTETARGMMIMNAKAQGLQGPKLMPLAFGQSKALLQWIDLCRENLTGEIPLPLRGDASGAPEWALISEADLEGDIVVYPRPGSWIPHPREEKQAALQNAFTVFGQILLDPSAPPELKKAIKTAYQLDMDLDGGAMLAERNAALKLEEMEDLLDEAKGLVAQGILMGMIPPDQPEIATGQLLVKMVPPDEKLDDPAIYLSYFGRWLMGDRAREAEPALKAGVRALWEAYGALAEQKAEAAIEQQAKTVAKLEAAKEEAKAKSNLALEAEKHKNKMEEQGLKGTQDMIATALEPTPEAPLPEPPEEDTGMRDHFLEKDRAEQDHTHRMKELLAKGAVDAALQPPAPPQLPQMGAPGMPPGQVPSMAPQMSIAGQDGSLVSGTPLVPGLEGLPPQPAM